LFLGVLALGLRLPAAPRSARQLKARLFGTARPERPPALPNVDMPLVEPPQFTVAEDATSPVAALPAAAVLAPRPDPTHPNKALPITSSAKPTVILKLFVLADGAVGAIGNRLTVGCGLSSRVPGSYTARRHLERQEAGGHRRVRQRVGEARQLYQRTVLPT
jgi:hypothetical protein